VIKLFKYDPKYKDAVSELTFWNSLRKYRLEMAKHKISILKRNEKFKTNVVLYRFIYLSKQVKTSYKRIIIRKRIKSVNQTLQQKTFKKALNTPKSNSNLI